MEQLVLVAAARRPIRACSVASFHALALSADAMRRSRRRDRNTAACLRRRSNGLRRELAEIFEVVRTLPVETSGSDVSPAFLVSLARASAARRARLEHSHCLARSRLPPFLSFLWFVNILGTSCYMSCL